MAPFLGKGARLQSRSSDLALPSPPQWGKASGAGPPGGASSRAGLPPGTWRDRHEPAQLLHGAPGNPGLRSPSQHPLWRGVNCLVPG